MEKFSQFQNSNIETGWENPAEAERDRILAEISKIEQRIVEIQNEKQQNIEIMNNAETLSDAHAQGIFEERFEYEMRRLDAEEYNLDVEVSGLKFQLSKLENN